MSTPLSMGALRNIAAVATVATALVLAGAPAAEAQLGASCDPASIAGTARDGETLTASRGSCSGFPTPTVRLQWFKCDAEVQNCVSRTSQTPASSLDYTVQPADVNGRLVVQQTATNTFGNDLDNTSTDIVAAIPPSATPTISGIAQIGQELTGSVGFLSGTNPSVTGRQWLRCEAGGAPCTAIPGAIGSRYILTAEDTGKTIRFQVTVQGPQHTVNVVSAATATVPPPPPPQPPPGSGSPQPPAPAEPTLLDPFPSVVIAGRVFRVRAVVSMLLVRGPRGAQVSVICRGRRCPRRRLDRTIRSRSVRLRPFETRLLPGTVLVIRVTKGRGIGKFARLRIRSGQPPARTDLCLTPGKRRPVQCPEGVG